MTSGASAASTQMRCCAAVFIGAMLARSACYGQQTQTLPANFHLRNFIDDSLSFGTLASHSIASDQEWNSDSSKSMS